MSDLRRVSVERKVSIAMEKGKASGAKVFGGSSSRRRLEIPVFSGEDAYLWVS